MPNQAELPIHDMAERHRGLTVAVANGLTEAASVCLGRHHYPPTDFDLDSRNERSKVAVQWKPASLRAQFAWANDIDATESGACACVLAAVELIDGMVAVRRAETKTGADYYIAPAGSFVEVEDLDDCLRLEVSGVDRGPESAVDRRLREKLAQADAGESNLPAVAGVVGFRARLIKLADLD